MDPLKSTGTNMPISTPAKAAPAASEQKSGEAPADRVEIGGEPGFVHKALRGVAQVVGGVVGFVPGAATGAVKGAGSEKVLTASPEATKFVRFAGAAMGLAVGFGSCLAAGPLGLAVGVIGGPIIGSIIGGAAPGAVDGAHAAVKGTVKGALSGMRKGAEYGGKAVDWVYSNFIPHGQDGKPGKPETPPASPDLH